MGPKSSCLFALQFIQVRLPLSTVQAGLNDPISLLISELTFDRSDNRAARTTLTSRPFKGCFSPTPLPGGGGGGLSDHPPKSSLTSQYSFLQRPKTDPVILQINHVFKTVRVITNGENLSLFRLTEMLIRVTNFFNLSNNCIQKLDRVNRP